MEWGPSAFPTPRTAREPTASKAYPRIYWSTLEQLTSVQRLSASVFPVIPSRRIRLAQRADPAKKKRVHRGHALTVPPPHKAWLPPVPRVRRPKARTRSPRIARVRPRIRFRSRLAARPVGVPALLRVLNDSLRSILCPTAETGEFMRFLSNLLPEFRMASHAHQ